MNSTQKSDQAGIRRSYLRLSWIILSGVLALVLLVGSNIWFDFKHETDLLRQDIETFEGMQSLSIRQTIQESVVTGNWNAVEAEFRRLEVVLVGTTLRLESPAGTLLANGQQSRPDGPIGPEEASVAQNSGQRFTWLIHNGTLRVITPITSHNGQVIAILIDETNQRAKFVQLDQGNIQHANRVIIIMTIVLGLVLLINWKLFNQPFARIFHISNAMVQGSPAGHIPDSPVIEVQRVIIAYNTMIDHLARQRASLEKMNRALEDTVSERTCALEASNTAIRERADQVEAMNMLIASTAAAMDMPALVHTALEQITRIMHTSMGMLRIGETAARVGIDHAAESRIGQSAAASGMTRMQKLVVNDWNSISPDHPHYQMAQAMGQFHARSSISLPIHVNGRLVGQISLADSHPRNWTPAEIALLEIVIHHLETATERALTVEDIRTQNDLMRKLVVQSEQLFEAESAQRKLAEALRDVTATLTSTLDLDEVLEGILSNLGKVVAHDAAIIMLIDKNLIRPVRWQGMPDGYSEAFKTWNFPVDELHNRQVMFETVQAMVIPDITQDPHWVRTVGMEWVRSYAGAPICQRGEVTGFIDVMAGQPNFYHAETGAILQAFANQAAIALENARLYHNTQQRMAETSALYRAVQPLFNTVEDIETLAGQITASVTQEFASAHCSLLFVTEERTRLRLVSQSGSLHLFEPDLWLDGPGLTVAAVKSGRTVYSPDVWQDPNYVYGAEATRSELVIPMYGDGRVIGVLNLESPEVDAFDERGRRLLASFAEQAALGLENARLFATIRENAEQMTKLNEIAQRRAQEAETMRQAITALSSTLDLNSVLDSILDYLDQVVPHTSATMFLVEDEKRLVIGAAKNLPGGWKEVFFPRDDELFLEIERSRRPVALPDIQVDPRFHGWGGTSQIHSWMGVPLIKSDELVGILTLDRIEQQVFRPEEIELAQAFANQAAIAVQNARLYESAQRRARELEALHTATTSLVTTLDLQKLLERILVSATEAIPSARAAALHLLDDTGQMYLRVQHGLDADEMQSPEWAANNGLRSWVLQQRQPMLVSNARRFAGETPDSGLPDTIPGESLMITPLFQEDQPLGLITLTSPDPSAFGERDLHLLISFASTATAAIHNAQLHSAVQHLAITDPLTGIYNRRGFYNLAEHLLEQAVLSHRPLSAIMIDVDFFKKINDQYGHDVGDIVLQALAERCRKVLRDSDLICRYGGEEFTILLAESDLDGAQGVAIRLFRSITETPMETAAGPVRVTISVGVATYDEGCTSLDQLLKRADLALYLSKGRGRNQVQVWSEELG